MSTWIEIKEQWDITYDPAPLTGRPSIDVLVSDDDFGNNYVSIPVKFIINVLKENGYEIE